MFHMHYIIYMANYTTTHYGEFTNYCAQFMVQVIAETFKPTDGWDDHQWGGGANVMSEA